MRNNPCFHCEDRFPGCHGKCQKESYLKFREKLQKIKENKVSEMKQEQDFFEMGNRKRKK